MNRFRNTVGIVMVLVGAAVLCVSCVGCGRTERAAGASDAVEIALVDRREFSSAVSALGAVKPQVGAEVKVGARISGRVERLYANIRDQVRKGQVIAELEKAELEATVAERRAELQLAEARLTSLDELFPREVAKANADVARWEATVMLATKDVARHGMLLREGIASQEASDEAQERLAVATAQLDAAHRTLDLVRTQYAENRKQMEAERDRSRATLTNAQVQLAYATITAPVAGVIGSVSTQEGETVAAGLNAPTFVTIVDLRRLQVEAYVDEVDIGKIQLGQRAVFTVDAFPSVDFEGQVVAIYPKAMIQDNVVKYTVALEVTTPYEGRLRPEMTATVAIVLEPRQVLAIPSRAVQRDAGRTFVYLSVKGLPESREVKLGWRDGQWVEVASGLEQGQQIFIQSPQAQ